MYSEIRKTDGDKTQVTRTQEEAFSTRGLDALKLMFRNLPA